MKHPLCFECIEFVRCVDEFFANLLGKLNDSDEIGCAEAEAHDCGIWYLDGTDFSSVLYVSWAVQVSLSRIMGLMSYVLRKAFNMQDLQILSRTRAWCWKIWLME